jgi:hypothetical protein
LIELRIRSHVSIALACDMSARMRHVATARSSSARIGESAFWHTAGLPANAWTVGDAGELERRARLGIDGVFANDPAHAIAVCCRRSTAAHVVIEQVWRREHHQREPTEQRHRDRHLAQPTAVWTHGSAARSVLDVCDEREPAVRHEVPAMCRSPSTVW